MAHHNLNIYIDQGLNEDWIKTGLPDVDATGQEVLPTRNGKETRKLAREPLEEGGKGSGHEGHAGVLGQQGGSAPGAGGSPEDEAKRAANRARVQAFRAKKKAEKAAGQTNRYGNNLKAAGATKGTAPHYDDPEEARQQFYNACTAQDNVPLIKMLNRNMAKAEGVAFPDERAEQRYNDYGYAGVLSSMANSGYTERGELKDDICRRLEERNHRMAEQIRDATGYSDEYWDAMIDYNSINATIGSWAASSGDNQAASVAAQRAAASLFGVKAGFYAKSANPTQTSKASEERTGRAIEAMYAETQEQLAQAGVKTVRLYRGVTLPAGETGSVSAGDVFEFQGNPMSSWSLSPTTPESFNSPGYGQRGFTLQMDIPAEKIVGTCATGYGCYGEQEVVVLGGVTDQAVVIRTREHW